MKVGELKKILEFIDDDFDLEIGVSKEIPEEVLKTMQYPYPFVSEQCKIDEGYYDIGHSSKLVLLHVLLKEL